MRIRVVQCPCGNPKPHRKLQAANGQKSSGFFSLVIGRKTHALALSDGVVTQTEEEKAETEAEIEACGLPEEYVSSEDDLRKAAERLVVFYSPTEREKMIAASIEAGTMTPESATKVRGYMAELTYRY